MKMNTEAKCSFVHTPNLTFTMYYLNKLSFVHLPCGQYSTHHKCYLIFHHVEVPVLSASSTWVESVLLRNSLTVVLLPEVSFCSCSAFLATRRMVSTSPVWPSPSKPPQLLSVLLILPRSWNSVHVKHVMTFIMEAQVCYINVSCHITFLVIPVWYTSVSL